jgi:hypothetical protein
MEDKDKEERSAALSLVASAEDPVWDHGEGGTFVIAEPKWGKNINIALPEDDGFWITEPKNEIALEHLGALGNGLLALHRRIEKLEEKIKELES